jgi:hypothetical protein
MSWELMNGMEGRFENQFAEDTLMEDVNAWLRDN